MRDRVQLRRERGGVLVGSRSTTSGCHSSIAARSVGSIASTLSRANTVPTTITSPWPGGCDDIPAQIGPSSSSGGDAPARNGYGPVSTIERPDDEHLVARCGGTPR